MIAATPPHSMYLGEIHAGDVWSRRTPNSGPFVWARHDGPGGLRIELRSYGGSTPVIDLVSELELRKYWRLVRPNPVGTLIAVKLAGEIAA